MLEQMILRQMAFEHIFAAEKLSVSEEEFQEEYQAAKRDFEEKQSEYDDTKLREQVSETLKVSCCAVMHVEKNAHTQHPFAHCHMWSKPGLQKVSAVHVCMVCMALACKQLPGYWTSFCMI